MRPPENEAEISDRIVRWLRCPESHGQLSVSGSQISCSTSDFRGSIRDGVVVMLPDSTESYFDDKYQVMKHGQGNKGEWDFCYARQTEHLSGSLEAGMLVADIGCGPVLPYRKPEGVNIVGLEPSFHSIRANEQLDLRVFGTAYAMPFADASIDAVVCFYAIHHMVGESRGEAPANVGKAFREFGRVLKPGGTLFVFEMVPRTYFWCVQRLFWNSFKRMIGKNLDMYFWSAREMEKVGRSTLPAGASMEKSEFQISPFTWFPPIFSLPKIKVPRLIYPLSPMLFKWRMPSGTVQKPNP